MDDQNTVWQPVEPTTPVRQYPYERTVHAPNPYDAIPIPPPPPKKRKTRRVIGVLLGIAVLLLSSSALTYWTVTYHASVTQPTPIVRFVQVTPTVMQSPTPQPTPQPTSAVNWNYTASDIVGYMKAVDNTVGVETTGKTVCIWSHKNYCLSVHATSSVQFIGCPIGNCADAWHFGIWVYATPHDAEIAYQEVANDSQTCTDTSPASSGMYVVCGGSYGGTEQEYAHGRCLLLNAVDTSVYGQVVTQYCV